MKSDTSVAPGTVLLACGVIIVGMSVARTSTGPAPMPGAVWFPDAKLNYAEAMLRMPGRSDDDVMIVGRSQTRDPVDLTAAQVRDQILEERRREFFLEGHRLGDMRRFNVPLSPAVGAPYPHGNTYGDQRCFPLPDSERNNNPNLS